ncbi:unnamed protein product [Ixodes pacificus]
MNVSAVALIARGSAGCPLFKVSWALDVMLRERLREASLEKLIAPFSSHKPHKRTTQSCRPAVSAVTEWEGTSKDVELSNCYVTLRLQMCRPKVFTFCVHNVHTFTICAACYK